ncbi:hypothetical protein [Streptosporangium sp. NPDC023615]|uniref:hypothetical protein n=1 Tax=Streptosporangium sp. NPDC023615 TaxID=3154794 RepID=UPI0034132895
MSSDGSVLESAGGGELTVVPACVEDLIESAPADGVDDAGSGLRDGMVDVELVENGEGGGEVRLLEEFGVGRNAAAGFSCGGAVSQLPG